MRRYAERRTGRLRVSESLTADTMHAALRRSQLRQLGWPSHASAEEVLNES